MNQVLRTLVLAVLAFLIPSISAQSTSPMMRIGDASFGDATAPAPGAGYLSVFLRAATANQNSGWWTNFVENHRQAVLTINLSGTVANIPVAQVLTGNPIELHRNKSLVDLGYSGAIVDHLPTTFTGLSMDLQINKTAQDGLQGLLTQVSQLSSGQPPVLAISQQALGYVSLSKNIADFLFHSNLLVKKADVKVPFPIVGNPNPGIYVVFAGDSATDYEQYLAGPTKLRWSGAQLTFSGVPVQQVSYFIVEVGYKSRFFGSPLDALSFGASKSWVTLYLLAAREVPQINNATQAETTANDIQSHMNDAKALLDADPDYIQGEKDEIAAAVYKKINDSYRSRLQQLAVDTQPAITPGLAPATPGGSTTTHAGPRPVLLAPDPVLQHSHDILMPQLNTNPVKMIPTSPKN